MKNRVLFFLFFAMLWNAGCGGRSKSSKQYDCEEMLNDILARKKENVCDPIAIERFEMRVVSFRKDCESVLNHKQKQQLNKKLRTAAQYAEEEGLAANQRRICADRVNSIAQTNESCTGQACVGGLENIKLVVEDCKTPSLDGPHMTQARKMVLDFQERIEEEERLNSLTRLREVCEKNGANAKKHRAKGIFKKLLKAMRKTTDFKVVPRKGSQVEMAKNQAIEVCDEVLRPVVGWLAEALRNGMNDKNIKNSPKRLKRKIKRVEQMRGNLVQTGAGAIFDEITGPIDEILKEHGIVPEKIPVLNKEPPKEEPREEPKKEPKEKPKEEPKKESAQIKKNQPIAADNKAPVDEKGLGATSASEDRNFLKTSEKTCKKHTKEIERFKSKIGSHTKKGSKKKVKAYQSNLDKTNQALNSLNEQIDAVVKRMQLPKDELDTLLKKLAEAGCSG